MNIKISVIIPVYKVEKYLPQCLDSVISQSLQDIEIFCVNDGSPDRSAEILDDYAKRDNRIHVITQENKGLSAARNVGSAQATGKYLFFLDSDDLLLPDALQTMYDFAEQNNLQVLRAEQEFLFEDESSKSTQHRKKYLHHINGYYPNQMDGPSMLRELLENGDFAGYISMWLFQREHVENHCLRFHEGALYEDIAYVFSALAAAERARVCHTKVYIYRVHCDSILGEEGKSFSYCHGWFTFFQDVLRAAEHYNFTADPVVMEYIFRKLDNARNLYTVPSQEEREKYKIILPEAERVVFRYLVMEPALLKEKNILLTKEINQIRGEITRIKQSRAYKLSCLMRLPVRWLRKVLRIRSR